MKEKYSVEIAGVPLNLISDDKEEFVNLVVARLDKEIRDLTVNNKRCSKMDAALLCALDYCAEKVKADKRIRNLEAQISLYDANLRRLREENAALTAHLSSEKPAEAPVEDPKKEEAPAAEAKKASAKDGDAPASSGKLKQLELMLNKIKEENR